jgi:perosamine synthetase
MSFQSLKIPSSALLSEVLEVIDQQASGACFVVDGHRLVGVVTDGDIRRALLSGATLTTSVDAVMKRDFFSLPVGSSLLEIQKHVTKYRYVPIISENGELHDLATPERYHQIPLVQPVLDGNELEYVTDCISTGWISSQGKYVKRFEVDFLDYVGGTNALAVSNGTVALHLALVALGIGPGDEVIVPDLTFAAPVNAVLHSGATPVLVDVDQRTMAIDPKAVLAAITNRTRGIVPVHLYGHPADMTSLMAIADKHRLLVVEDCAEALGSRCKGKHVGTFGHASTFSFFGNKTITTGEGGMVLFKDRATHDRAMMLRDHGMSPERRYWHEEAGFNYRLTNLQAAIGVAQLERVADFVAKKHWIAAEYGKHLSSVEELCLPGNHGQVENSHWLYTVILSPKSKSRRDVIMNELRRQGVEVRSLFIPMHRMPPYQKYKVAGCDYEVANFLSDSGISLPSSVMITEKEIAHVSSVLRAALTTSIT